jgi:hypothetical protein
MMGMMKMSMTTEKKVEPAQLDLEDWINNQDKEKGETNPE